MEFPEGLEYIRTFAFAHCNNLLSIRVPKTLKEIGGAAFFECNKLKSAYISDIESWSNVVFVNNPLGMIEHLYLNNEEITDLELPDGIKYISDYAFYNKPYITSVKMPNSIISTGIGSFAWCKNLKNIVLSNNLEQIAKETFIGCSSLSQVLLPNTLASIRDDSFAECISLKKILIPNSVNVIGMGAFADCSSLDTLIIGRGIIEIDFYAFGYCEHLRDVFCYRHNAPSSNKQIFIGSTIEKVNLHVPEESFDNYKTNDDWKNFGNITRLPKILYMVDNVLYMEDLVMIETPILPVDEPTKEGYTFSGWNDIPETMPFHDVTVTGTFTINKYKLTYMLDGELYKSYDVEYGAAIAPEPAPTKDYYTFSGWSDIPATMPAHDVTVTGSFAINKYKVTYMVDNAEYKSYELEYGAKITPEAAPTKEGYTFSGWSEIPATMPAHDVTVTGTFAINKYNLVYKVDGVDYKSYEIEFGATITPEPAPTKEGYTFSGWSWIPTKMPAEDVTVTGSFTINQYTITYIIDNEVYTTQTVDYGSNIIPPTTPEREGYDFAWGDYPETMPAYDITIYGTYTTGFEAIMAGEANCQIFSLDGKPLNELQKGVNIARLCNGQIRKVVVK